MAYPYGNSSEDFTLSEINSSDFSPQIICGGIVDNHTAVNNLGMRNTVGYQIALVQNFANIQHLSRHGSPIASGFISNISSTESMYIESSDNIDINANGGSLSVWGNGGMNLKTGGIGVIQSEDFYAQANQEFSITAGYINLIGNSSSISLTPNASVNVIATDDINLVSSDGDLFMTISGNISLFPDGNINIAPLGGTLISSQTQMLIVGQADIELSSVDNLLVKSYDNQLILYASGNMDIDSLAGIDIRCVGQLITHTEDTYFQADATMSCIGLNSTFTATNDTTLSATENITIRTYNNHINVISAGDFNVVFGGNFNLSGIPTSSVGLSSGDVWSSGNMLAIIA